MSSMRCTLWLSGTSLGRPLLPFVHTLLVEGWRVGRKTPSLLNVTTTTQAQALLRGVRTPGGGLRLFFPTVYNGIPSPNLLHILDNTGLDAVWSALIPHGQTDQIRPAGTHPRTLFIGPDRKPLIPLTHAVSPHSLEDYLWADSERTRIQEARFLMGSTLHEALALHAVRS